MCYKSQCGERLIPSPRSLSYEWVARRYSPLETIVVYVSRTRKLNPHCWSVCYESQCGDNLVRLSSDIAGVFVTSRSVVKGSSAFRPSGPMILGAQAPGKVGSTLLEIALWGAVWRKSCPTFVSPGKQAKRLSLMEIAICVNYTVIWGRGSPRLSTLPQPGDCALTKDPKGYPVAPRVFMSSSFA
ncbi:hypothetical protein E4K67_29500 [Desulfosporosinus fructosivorans]|uniref:Uncharacterized protein n=1 Tax=Desulfosporosinus fructosivorans TaxID=2018669 RepID=A0A4Z0QV87_9FIRM|nr:hypothetical protein E4K67_29500 [Desulfosporosinus fructosivorans]